MIDYENDTYISILWAFKPAIRGKQSLEVGDQMTLMLFTANSLLPLKYDDFTRRHIRAFAYNYRWNNTQGGSETSSERIEMRPCTL